MQLRHGFVSNSSSSSFIIRKDQLTAHQIQQIMDHATVGEAMGLDYAGSDSWSIDVTDTEVRGWTSMDNFDMRDFLIRIGVGSQCPNCGHATATVDWDEGHFWESPWESNK